MAADRHNLEAAARGLGELPLGSYDHGEDDARSACEEVLEARGWRLESYRTPPPGYYYPPGSRRFGIPWPSGFAGGGWLVRGRDGEVLYAHAWRADCLAWIDAQAAAHEIDKGSANTGGAAGNCAKCGARIGWSSTGSPDGLPRWISVTTLSATCEAPS